MADVFHSSQVSTLFGGYIMATITGNNSTSVVLIAALLLLAFAGGYYYYREKDKDTILDVNIGGKNITAEVDHE